MAKLFSHWKLHLEISATGPLCAVSAGTMASGKDRVSRTLERTCFSGFDYSTWTGLLLPNRSMCGQALKAAGRRLSESRMRENLMSGSMWQGMETRVARPQAPFPDPTPANAAGQVSRSVRWLACELQEY